MPIVLIRTSQHSLPYCKANPYLYRGLPSLALRTVDILWGLAIFQWLKEPNAPVVSSSPPSLPNTWPKWNITASTVLSRSNRVKTGTEFRLATTNHLQGEVIFKAAQNFFARLELVLTLTETCNLFVLYNKETYYFSFFTSKSLIFTRKPAFAHFCEHEKAIWRYLLSIQNEAISLVAMRGKELWLVQKNYTSVKLVSHEIKTYSESRK